MKCLLIELKRDRCDPAGLGEHVALTLELGRLTTTSTAFSGSIVKFSSSEISFTSKSTFASPISTK